MCEQLSSVMTTPFCARVFVYRAKRFKSNMRMVREDSKYNYDEVVDLDLGDSGRCTLASDEETNRPRLA